MKNLYILITVCFIFSDCTSKKSENAFRQFDVSTNYPEKKIFLEEIAEIEYLQLKMDDDFLFASAPHIVTSKKIILSQDGDVLIFSRNGEPLSKFNRKGNGPGEYTYIRKLLFDETTDEFFLHVGDKIFIYSSSGDFKRSIPLPDRMEDIFCQFVNYDSKCLLLYNDFDVYPNPFTFISKVDGRVVDSIMLPKGNYLERYASSGDYIFYAPSYWIVKHHNGYILTDYSIDTVYLFSHDKKLSPILERKPHIQSMDPIIYLNSFVEAGNYEFVSAITVKSENGQRLPRKYLMRDKKSGTVYRQNITFKDYIGKQVYISPETIENTQDDKLGLIILDMFELKEANNEKKISGILKDLVESSDDEDNSIFMLLHFK